MITIDITTTDYRAAHHAWAAACDAPGVGAVYPAAMLAEMEAGARPIVARMAAERACRVVDEERGGFGCQRPGEHYAWGYGSSRVTLHTMRVGDPGYRLTLRITGPAGSSVMLRAMAAAKVIEEAAPSHGYPSATTTDDDTIRERADVVEDVDGAEA